MAGHTRIEVGRSTLLREARAYGVSVVVEGECREKAADVVAVPVPERSGAVSLRGETLLGLLFLSLLAGGGSP